MTIFSELFPNHKEVEEANLYFLFIALLSSTIGVVFALVGCFIPTPLWLRAIVEIVAIILFSSSFRMFKLLFE